MGAPPSPVGPRANNKLMAWETQDSMSMVTVVIGQYPPESGAASDENLVLGKVPYHTQRPVACAKVASITL